MATYDANTRWAARTGRRAVTIYLSEQTIEGLDTAASRLRKDQDAITGKRRKPGRAQVIEKLVDGDLRNQMVSGMAESFDSIRASCDRITDMADEQREDAEDRLVEAESEVAELSKHLTQSEKHADRLSGELEAARARIATLEAYLDQEKTKANDDAEAELSLMRNYASTQSDTITQLRAQVLELGGNPDKQHSGA